MSIHATKQLMKYNRVHDLSQSITMVLPVPFTTSTENADSAIVKHALKATMSGHDKNISI